MYCDVWKMFELLSIKYFFSNVILYKLLHLSCAYNFRFCTLLLPGLFVHSTVRINVNCFLLEWFYQCWTYSKWTKLLQSQKEHRIKDICEGVPIISMMFLSFSSIYGLFKYLYRKTDISSKIPRVNCRSACNILIPICTYLLMEFYCIKQCFMCSICSGAQARQRK